MRKRKKRRKRRRNGMIAISRIFLWNDSMMTLGRVYVEWKTKLDQEGMAEFKRKVSHGRRSDWEPL